MWIASLPLIVSITRHCPNRWPTSESSLTGLVTGEILFPPTHEQIVGLAVRQVNGKRTGECAATFLLAPVELDLVYKCQVALHYISFVAFFADPTSVWIAVSEHPNIDMRLAQFAVLVIPTGRNQSGLANLS